MIVELIFYILIQIVTKLTLFLPGAGQVPLKIPWGMDDILVTGVMGFKTIAQAFPPFTIVLNAFIIYFLFRIGLQLFKALPLLGRTVHN